VRFKQGVIFKNFLGSSVPTMVPPPPLVKHYVPPFSKVICRPCHQGKTFFLESQGKRYCFFFKSDGKCILSEGKSGKDFSLYHSEPCLYITILVNVYIIIVLQVYHSFHDEVCLSTICLFFFCWKSTELSKTASRDLGEREKEFNEHINLLKILF